MTVLQQQHHNQYRCTHQYTPNSYDSWGELPSISIIHEIPYITIWKQHPCHWSFTKKNPMRDNSQDGKRRTTKAKRIIWGENLKRKPELAVVGVNYFHLHLSVCCSHTHKKKMMRKISLLCKLSRFGSCCLPEDEWKSSIACVDWDDEHVEFSGFLFCPEIAGLHSCRWWQPWIETNEREILRDIERDRETGRQREIEREREYERIKII